MAAPPRPVGPAPTHRPARPRKRSRQTTWLIAGGLLVFGAVVLLPLVVLVAVLLYSSSETSIPSGVAVAGVALGGESVSDAETLLAAQNFAAQPLILADGERQWPVTFGQMGINVDVPATVQLARDAAPGTSVLPWYTIDFNLTQNTLITLSEQINIAAIPGQAGRALDIPLVLDRLYRNLAGEVSDGMLDLSMIEIAPPEPGTLTADTYQGPTTVHVVEPGQELALIAEMYDVSLADIVALNELDNPDLLYIGQELTIPAAGVYEPSAAQAPPAPTSAGKSILVSVGDQRIYAYENGQLVHSHLVSTGLPGTPTVLGDYTVQRKYEKTDMSGPDYYLPDVPYTMYFFQGYAIHGTYWHNSFGRPMSHGCVNLPTDEAQWFFNWADMGTPVRVV